MNQDALSFILSQCMSSAQKDFEIYPKSVYNTQDGPVFMASDGLEDVLIAPAATGFAGKTFVVHDRLYVNARLTHENAVILRLLFPFTAPQPILKQARTLGVGDRLGIATAGHIRAFGQYDAYPIFAQQSIRELNLTGRTFFDVLDCVSFSVFREGYTRGYGADGDHVKTAQEVEYALNCGYSMITLDCSAHINNAVADMTDEEVLTAYESSPRLEKQYMNRSFRAGTIDIAFDEMTFRRMCLIYNNAIAFAISIYKQFFADRGDALDFEVSIDETLTPTEPAQHFYIANELISNGVKPASIAPRFCGEFQKGVDYRGDLVQFEMEFAAHAEIARHFGYKISVHSGSDKFSVFSIVGKHTCGRFHLKTAGTSWLEAMAVIAKHEPALYREIHAFALETGFAEAKKYYHVSTNLENIPQLDTLRDEELIALFCQEDARQLIHITYGAILNAKYEDGSDRFRSRLYVAWQKYEEEYASRLERHIGRHLSALYSGFQ